MSSYSGGYSPQGLVATVITIGVLSAAGLFSGANTFTGGQTFTHTININTTPQLNYSGHKITMTANTQTLVSLNNTQTLNGNNTIYFGAGGILQRNPASTFATKFIGPSVLSNQTVMLTGSPITNFTTGQTSGNATTTASTATVMSGDYATLTPQITGKVQVTISGQVDNAVATDGCRIDLRQSTTNMGVGGSAASGTVIGTHQNIYSPTASANMTYSKTVTATGLTLGTKYFFDMGQSTLAGGSCTIRNIDWFVREY